MSVTVTLTYPEVMQAAQVGIMRLVGNMKRGLSDKFGTREVDRWGVDIEGACGEMATAKYLGHYWSGSIGNFYAADVGKLQVRTTQYANGHLIVHSEDSDDHVFILVTGKAPAFSIHGWIAGAEAKSDKWWTERTGRPAFFVPGIELAPIETLIQHLPGLAA